MKRSDSYPPRPASALAAFLAFATCVVALWQAAAAPLPPIDKINITGTIAELKWVPKTSVKALEGASGTLGTDRVFPAHFVVSLRNYTGPNTRQAWMLNEFVGAKSEAGQDRGRLPALLVVWINSNERGLLKSGMKIRLKGYKVTGDEGGTWVSHEHLEIVKESP